MGYGIRVGEAVPSDVLANDGVYEFVFCFCPQNARGAVSGSCPPIALGQPRGAVAEVRRCPCRNGRSRLD